MNGKWVVRVDDKLIGEGKNFEELKLLVKKAREKYPKKTPYVEHIPEKLPEVLLL
jgi:hypothetical protein